MTFDSRKCVYSQMIQTFNYNLAHTADNRSYRGTVSTKWEKEFFSVATQVIREPASRTEIHLFLLVMVPYLPQNPHPQSYQLTSSKTLA